MTTTTAVDAKRDVAIANRILWAIGLCAGVTASLGHASLRLPERPDRFLVKGRGYKMDALAAMKPEEAGHSSRPLQRRHVHVQVHSVDSFDLQRHVLPENLCDRP